MILVGKTWKLKNDLEDIIIEWFDHYDVTVIRIHDMVLKLDKIIPKSDVFYPNFSKIQNFV